MIKMDSRIFLDCEED